MNEKREWLAYKANWKYRKLREKITGNILQYKKVNGRAITGAQEANRIVCEKISSKEPFAFTRYGMWEIDCAVCAEQDRILGTHSLEDMLLSTGGMFDDIQEFNRWIELVKKDSRFIDYSAIWYRVKMEDWILKKYAGQAKVLHYSALEPYYFDKPWSSALKGKTVLVVNPFAELIKKQYARREKLFQNKDVLPGFELKTMPSVWFIDKNTNQDFNDWFEALEYMKGQLRNQEFDIVILGCGPFGLHLAVEAKRMGKQAIVMGGATQILFGIKGKRWDEIPEISRLYNDFWIRPSDEYKPQGAQKLDEGCYW